MSNTIVRRMSKDMLTELADDYGAKAALRELARRQRQSERDLARRPARIPRARSQPGGNHRIGLFTVQTPTGPQAVRMRVGYFIPYNEVRPAPQAKQSVDFDQLAAIPVERIFTIGRVELPSTQTIANPQA